MTPLCLGLLRHQGSHDLRGGVDVSELVIDEYSECRSAKQKVLNCKGKHSLGSLLEKHSAPPSAFICAREFSELPSEFLEVEEPGLYGLLKLILFYSGPMRLGGVIGCTSIIAQDKG